MPCNRRAPGSGCAARNGHAERHALFGWTDQCIATQPVDPAVALVVLDAHVVTRTAGGGRRIPVTDFHVLPADGVNRDTVLESGELIEAIELDRPAPDSAYVKVRERESYEFALVSAAATVELGDGGRDRERAHRGRVGGDAPVAADRRRAPCGRARAQRSRRDSGARRGSRSRAPRPGQRLQTPRSPAAPRGAR